MGIDSKTIAGRFESISGTQIYGVSNWCEWCTLERALELQVYSMGKLISFPKNSEPAAVNSEPEQEFDEGDVSGFSFFVVGSR